MAPRREDLEAWLFDLDGVLTDTAATHAAAWKDTFDRLLARRDGNEFVPFDVAADYRRYVDGMPRLDGVRSFLASRHIVLPGGGPGDAGDGSGLDSVWALASTKNQLVSALLAANGVAPFADAVTFVRALRAAGRPVGVVSASENAAAVLDAAKIADLFDVRVDGLVASEHHLAGKPAPDTYLYAARKLGIEPGRAAVVEDAPAGVTAGRAGQFGLVVGVARRAGETALRDAGADVVVGNLTQLLGTPHGDGTWPAGNQ